MATIPPQSTSASEPQPAWDIALLFPSQGDWSEGEYLGLETNRLVELVDGNLEVLPMPTIMHQLILEFLFDVLRDFVKGQNLGKVYLAPLPVYIRLKTYREPDLVFVKSEHRGQPGDKYLSGADLVIEIVSPDDKSQRRDHQEKRGDYAERGIAEYWIVDPQRERITVLALDGERYRVHGEFSPDQQASSLLLTGFSVDVAAAFAAGRNN